MMMIFCYVVISFCVSLEEELEEWSELRVGAHRRVDRERCRRCSRSCSKGVANGRKERKESGSVITQLPNHVSSNLRQQSGL